MKNAPLGIDGDTRLVGHQRKKDTCSALSSFSDVRKTLDHTIAGSSDVSYFLAWVGYNILLTFIEAHGTLKAQQDTMFTSLRLNGSILNAERRTPQNLDHANGQVVNICLVAKLLFLRGFLVSTKSPIDRRDAILLYPKESSHPNHRM